MLLNEKGEALCGAGGVPASVDGRPLPVSVGGFAWLDADTVVGQDGSDAAGWKVVALNVRTSTKNVLASTGASDVVGGGGRWQADLKTNPTRCFGSLGDKPGACVYAAGPGGTIAWKRSYQAPSGLTLSSPGVPDVDVPDANPLDVHVLGPGMAVWSEPGRLRAIGRPVPTTARPAGRTRVVTAAGDEWLVYFAEGTGLVAEVQGEGYVLEPRAVAFNHDAVAVGDEVIVGWSTTQGERAGDLVTCAVSRQGGVRFLIDPEGTGRQVPLWQSFAASGPSGQTSGPVATVRAHPRKLWMAPFYSFSERYGDTPIDRYRTYANAITVVGDDRAAVPRDLARLYPLGLPLIVDGSLSADMVAPYLGTIVAWWVAGATAAALESAVALATSLPEKPIIAYLDHGLDVDWPATRPAWISSRVWPGIQCYRLAGESIAAMQDRMERLCARIASYGVYAVLTPRFDDVNGQQTVSFTLEAMALYCDLIQRFPICGLMPFADRRGTGIAKDGSLLGWAQALANANPTRPNRYDYWQPTSTDLSTVLRNKLGQTTELIVLTPNEKAYLTRRL